MSLNRARKWAIASCFLFAVTTASVNGAVFTDQASYDAAVGTSVVPDDGTLAAIDFPLGDTDFYGFFEVKSEGGAGTPADAADFNAVGNFVFDFDPANLNSVTFTFDQPVAGVSGLWSNTFVEDGFRVSTPSNDYDLNVLAASLSDTFFGFTEDTPFTSVTFSTSNNIPGDDFVFFNSFTYAPVPEPATFGLIGMCLVGFGLVRRR